MLTRPTQVKTAVHGCNSWLWSVQLDQFVVLSSFLLSMSLASLLLIFTTFVALWFNIICSAFFFKDILCMFKISQNIINELLPTHLFLQNQARLHRLFERLTKLCTVLVSRGQRSQKATDTVTSWVTQLPTIQPRLEIQCKSSPIQLQHVLQPWQILQRTQITASLWWVQIKVAMAPLALQRLWSLAMTVRFTSSYTRINP